MLPYHYYINTPIFHYLITVIGQIVPVKLNSCERESDKTIQGSYMLPFILKIMVH